MRHARQVVALAVEGEADDFRLGLTLDEMVTEAGGGPAIADMASAEIDADDVADSMVLGSDPWAPEMSDTELKKIHAQADAIFNVIDLNADGAISLAELDCHLARCGYTAEAVAGIFDALDLDGTSCSHARARARARFIMLVLMPVFACSCAHVAAAAHPIR